MSKSIEKRRAAQGAPRFVAGFKDGSGPTHVRDMTLPGVSTVEGRTVAVTNWGCSCCQGEETHERIEMAKKIADALNLLDAVHSGRVRIVESK